MSSDRLNDLIERHVAGILTGDERRELESRLMEDAEARSRLLDASREVVALAEALGRPLPDLPPLADDGLPRADAGLLQTHTGSSTRRWGRAAAIAAAILVIVGGAWFLRTGDEPAQQLPTGHATREAGDTLTLGGTHVVFKTPSGFEVQPPAEGEERHLLVLHEGHVAIETTDGSAGLSVRTPSGVLRDIGTRFEVRVGRRSEDMKSKRSTLAGVVGVLVLSGLVEWSPTEANASAQVLRPGMGMMTLRNDGSIGKVKDREGLAQLRRRGQTRWRLAKEHRRLFPGDLVRTGHRGAHAAALVLENGVGLTVGPAAQVELTDVAALRLARGDLEVNAPDGVTVTVSGPDREIAVTGRKVVAVRNGALVTIDSDPVWLRGYKGDSVTDAMGALMASVDGRNVPLTMGYHKVSVDIRDRIARTVIDETFVNRTNRRLEGVFYFPLPAGASVSGFAMWVGGEKVHGDIVEKGRAREIYETILREKRDPGLLEWTGGNIFRARVFPIDSTKRIQISYTQVLPKTGDTYSYRYALRSELTRLTPLEQLEIDVRVSSSETLVDVTCPTHSCRIDRAEGAARVEYSAQEVTPDKDLEVRIRTAGPPADAPRLLPSVHRRSEDGFFLVRVAAPQSGSGDGPAPRKPVDLIIVADTSASMYGPQRRSQEAFIEALIAGLDEADRFQLITADVAARAAFQTPRAPDVAANSEALAFLERRQPLGWSDLGAALLDAFQRAKENTHIVYIGDGVVTRGQRDPAAFLDQMRTAWSSRGTVHSVAPANHDALVMQGLAALGGGSFRTLGDVGGDAPRAADALIETLSGPGLRDLELSFDGMDVAAVYPRSIGHVPAGEEIVVVGRYDPASPRLTGEAVLRGRSGGQQREWKFPLDLSQGDRGESFIPRLWARRELDALQRQGATAEIKSRITTLSEDYQIVTPYTSFLVLESDEDRERFGVKKRFRIRDGEAYFAKGRDDARFELAKKQIMLAKLWRKELRARTIRSLRDMGRGFMSLLMQRGPMVRDEGIAVAHTEYTLEQASGARLGAGKKYLYAEEKRLGDLRDLSLDGDMSEAEGEAQTRFEFDELRNELEANQPMDVAFEPPAEAFYQPMSLANRYVQDYDVARKSYRGRPTNEFSWREQGRRWRHFAPDALWPNLAGPVPAPRTDATWPKEIVDQLAKCDRRRLIEGADSGWRIVTEGVRNDGRGRALGTLSGRYLLSGKTWWIAHPRMPGDRGFVSWVDEARRGILDPRWMLGRTRPKKDLDERSWSGPWGWWFERIARTNSGYEPRMEKLPDDRVRVTLQSKSDPKARVELDIDTERSAFVEVRRYAKNELAYTVRYEDLTLVAGAWWPKRIVERDKKQVVYTATVTVESLAKETFDAATKARLATLTAATLMGPLPQRASAARKRVETASATLEDAWMLWRVYAQAQRNEEAEPFGQLVLDKLADKPGRKRVELAMLQHRRRNEEAKAIMSGMADVLARNVREADRAAAIDLFSASSVLAASERLTLLDRLRPAYVRRERLEPEKEYEYQRAGVLQGLGRPDAVREARRKLAEKYPFMSGYHTSYASTLASNGDVDDAVRWIDDAISKHGPWSSHERTSFWRAKISTYESSWRLEDAVATHAAWMAAEPDANNRHDHDRYLSNLIMLDRASQAQEHMRSWLQAALVDDPSDGVIERLAAALSHACDSGWGFWNRPYDPQWTGPLVEVVRRSLESERLRDHAARILRTRGFRTSREGEAVTADLFSRLEAQVASMEVQLWVSVFGWLRSASYVPESGRKAYGELLDAFLDRWVKSGKKDEHHRIRQLVQNRGSAEQKLRYARHAVAIASPDAIVATRHTLFGLLLEQGWKKELEDEAFALWAILESRLDAADPKKPDRDVVVMANALWQLDDWMLKRTDALLDADPKANELTRRERKQRRSELLAESRRHAIGRLRPLEASAPEGVRPWVRLERMWFEGRVGDLRPASAEALWRILRPVWDVAKEETTVDIEPPVIALANRAVASLTWLALQDGAESVRSDLLAFLDDGSPEDKGPIDVRTWRFILLVALDRVGDLTTDLRTWYGDGGPETARWGRALAYLLAETGDLKGAIPILESVHGHLVLSARDLRTLANWHLAEGNREGERAAKIASYDTMNEWNLSSWLSRQAAKAAGTTPPPDFDPEIEIALAALLKKATRPANHTDLVARLYKSTRDFRVLSGVAESVIGHSAQGVYAYLGRMKRVTDLIQEEATLDLLTDHLAKLREDPARTPVDRRALDMLQFLARYHALDQRIGTRDHRAAVMAALEAAGKGSWEEAERRYMADLLASLRLKPTSLVDHVADWMRDLHLGEDEVIDRYRVASSRARFLWKHDRKAEAVRVSREALEAVKRAHDGRYPTSIGQLVTQHVERLRGIGNHREGELVYKDMSAWAPNPEWVRWTELRLLEHYVSTVAQDGEVSIGSGERLSRALELMFDAAVLRRQTASHANALVSQRARLWKQVRDHGWQGHREIVEEFAFATLPRVLALYQHRDSHNIVSTVAGQVRLAAGYKTELAFWLARAENEPAWLALRRQDFWSRHSRSLENCFRLLGKSTDDALERRLQALVVRAMRQDFRMRRRSRALYDADRAGFWSSRRSLFRRVADEEIERADGHVTTIVHIAHYLWDDLNSYGRAVEVLEEQHARGALSVSVQRTLGQWLQESRRWKRSLEILTPLVEKRPGDLRLRSMIMVAAFRTNQPELVRSSFDAAEKWLRENGAATASNLAGLATPCVDTKLFADAARLYEEAINLRTRKARRNNDGTLAGWYRGLSAARLQLGDTDGAIDAAAGAVVCWGGGQKERAKSLSRLVTTLKHAKDLDAYVGRFEKQLAEQNLENPLMRRALAITYLDLDRPKNAARQADIALASSVGDLTLHDLAIKAWTKAGDERQATTRRLAAARAAGREVGRWKDVGDHFASTGDGETAERAWTTCVEVVTDDTGGFEALATVRTKQKRPADALPLWQQVDRIRPNSPKGLLGAVDAYIRLERYEEARAGIERLKRTKWAVDHEDLAGRITALEKRLR